MSKGVTPKSENYSKWYTDVITKAELADYGPVKGTMVIRPYGYQIWDNLKNVLDAEFKKTGHTNAYFPLFIPKSFLAKESEHVEGFAKECAIVTHSRLTHNEDKTDLIPDPNSKLEEEIIVRPTSETVIWSMYRKWINSHRDLPILINQWANVVRWEMRTRLFLRTSEFLWQEGHTAHSSEKEAEEETLKILDIYKKTVENILGIPVICGLKTESEKFAGAISWGVSTRLIGALIMVHGDDKGLRLPPNIAPIQIVIVPIYKSNDDLVKIQNYLDKTIKLFNQNNLRYLFDDREKLSPGYKFNEWEMKGVPIRLEVGLRDIENLQLTIVRRDTSDKISENIDTLSKKIPALINEIQLSLFNQAKQFQMDNTFTATSYDEFKDLINRGAFVECGWDGSAETEIKIKQDTNATIRCIPLNSTPKKLNCIYSSAPAKHKVIFAKAY